MNQLYEQQETSRIIQIIPCSRKMDLVYFEDLDNSLFRQPVVCMALLQVKDQYETYNKIVAVDYINGDNNFSTDVWDDPTEESNFIGIEFDDKQENWDYNIEKYKRELQRKKELIT